MGMSLLQKGSGFPFFAPSVYSYISGVDAFSITVEVEEIPNQEVTDMLQKVQFTTCFLLSG